MGRHSRSRSRERGSGRDRGRDRSRSRERRRSRSRERRRERRSSSRDRDKERQRRHGGSRERRRSSSRERRRSSSRDRRRSSHRSRSPGGSRRDGGTASRSRSRTRGRDDAGAPAAVPVDAPFALNAQIDVDRGTAAAAAPSTVATAHEVTEVMDTSRGDVAAAAGAAAGTAAAAAPAAPAARIGALAALKAKLAAAGGAAAAAAAAADGAPAATGGTSSPPPAAPAAAWAPWEDPSLTAGTSTFTIAPSAAAAAVPRSKAPSSAAPEAVPMFLDEDKPNPNAPYVVPLAVVIKRAKADAEELRDRIKAARGDDDEADPLDAFMAEAIMPEVQQRIQEEAQRKEAERIRMAELLKSGKPIKPLKVLEEISEEEEETPDLEIMVPTNRIKLLVGAGGLTIGAIQKKSKARVQIVKEEEALNRAWGSGPEPIKVPVRRGAVAKPKNKAICDAGASGEPALPAAPPPPPEEKKMTKVQLFGDAKSLEIAERMIWEAVDNKEQKAKQREKEYEKKREAKVEKRMLYHLRHTNDYEVLGIPIGSSRADIKKAYRKLALQWHPDKHQGDNLEEAVAKFQAIQKAYDSLTSTNEDDKIEALTGAPGKA